MPKNYIMIRHFQYLNTHQRLPNFLTLQKKILLAHIDSVVPMMVGTTYLPVGAWFKIIFSDLFMLTVIGKSESRVIP